MKNGANTCKNTFCMPQKSGTVYHIYIDIAI